MGKKNAVGGQERGALEHLDQQVVASARRQLDRLVAEAGGPGGAAPIPAEGLESVATLFQAWAEHHSDVTGLDRGERFRFDGNPGLWHALQSVVPLVDPDRWDQLRAAAIRRLESSMGWERETPPRGSVFLVPKGGPPPTVDVSEEQRRRIEERRRQRRLDR